MNYEVFTNIIKNKSAMTKKLILIAIAALFTVNVWGQTQIETSPIYYNNSNVGIGTINPGSTLHLKGAGESGVGALTINPGTTYASYQLKLVTQAATNGFYMSMGGTRIINAYGYNDADEVGFGIRNYADMLYLKGGKVGIGTTSPVGNLEIANSSGAVLSISTNKRNGNSTNPLKPTLDFLGYQNGNKARITAIEKTYNTHGSQLSFWVNDGVSSTSLVERLTILQNGNVGIGTTSPGSFKLAVEGKIGAWEVVVTTEGWADFVFEPNYNLMPLKELNTYIKANKHLPEIPTTAEVKENGISVGEMNAKLLQKIEELTLHTIKQQELIETLLQRVENLENK